MGKGGDLLYRWGNPEMYDGGGPDDRQLFFNHATIWIEPTLPGGGHLTVFDNGRDLPNADTLFSTVYELMLPYFVDYDGAAAYLMDEDGTFVLPEIIWQYSNPGGFYSNFVSGLQRLPNDHTLIDEGMTGRIFEVTPDGEVVWEYVSPVIRSGPLEQGTPIPPFSPGNVRQQNSLFRAVRYAPDFAGLEGKDLTPKGTIELMPTATEDQTAVPEGFALAQNYPNPFNPTTTLSFSVHEAGSVRLTVHNVLGQHVRTIVQARLSQGTHVVSFDASDLPSGVYSYRLEAGGFVATRKMMLVR